MPWKEIVKGYEYENGKYVGLKEDDFARVDVEATQTVDITNFVKIDAADPLLFYKAILSGGGQRRRQGLRVAKGIATKM